MALDDSATLVSIKDHHCAGVGQTVLPLGEEGPTVPNCESKCKELSTNLASKVVCC